jgi:hypothetical protein
MLISDMWWPKEYRCLLLGSCQILFLFAVVITERRLTSSDLNGQLAFGSDGCDAPAKSKVVSPANHICACVILFLNFRN